MPKSSGKTSVSIRVWTCCQCGDSGMTTNIPSCPSCYYNRCENCPVQVIKGKSNR
ncbi:hypothetical protein CGRA01v4_14733 [Colletotrichum graminicola]|uniref:Uncharacterized protein n=1 Tax=Colletotrichum graminicola (strain M1.001 / M2 / FGSC 10212) TaxID=645133 RepID=E3QF46_COLGM|nr:uncharacterized protein GLRG_04628 [Colletotrichum graminicola M1.001]EFQ29484.1 hypothetical protein GLRG_04628 [Colletotrichum graminicola M1.001]WDK23441.1 hypothetical protein CGRA01v4_14733 [Colletotrichum graminicola]